jgi:ATP-dependent exoDNAse (exonuclease V) beta subunit
LTGGNSPVNGELAPDARTVWQMLCDEARITLLSAEGQESVARISAVMGAALHRCRRMPLRELVESAWLALLGPACLLEAGDLDDAGQLLDLLETEAEAQAGGNDIIDLEVLDSRINRLFAGNSAIKDSRQAPPVQIMTIHKAKGLEFDTVIVPGLHRTPRQDDRKLLVWSEQLSEDQDDSDLLLAPIRETGADDEADAIYRYVQLRDRYQQQQEDVRLLYVAATRAENKLHLLATVIVKDTTGDSSGEARLLPPRAASLLASLWPVVSNVFVEEMLSRPAGLPASVSMHTPNDSRQVSAAMRVIADQPIPVLPIAISSGNGTAAEKTASSGNAIDFDWAGETARHVGTVTHAFLQNIADSGLVRWNIERIAASRTQIERELSHLGVGEGELPAAVDRVADALAHVLRDTRGRWILQSRPQARSEWRVTGFTGKGQVNVAIDRSFVDENGVRWIIDFKTGSHEGADIGAFLDNEQKRYHEQLETYAVLLNAMHPVSPKPVIRLGLYFPLLNGWREWNWQPR